jgi:predicted nuclease of predicted toxin-antitoxin system
VKLLFDHNLSPRLVRLLADVYPGSEHVYNLEMDKASDSDIWSFSGQNGWTIVTKDADFHQRSLLLGQPPKVIWLRLGNCSVSVVAALLRERYITIRYFYDDPDAAFLALS